MEFGIDKCKTLRMERGKWMENQDIPTMNNQQITWLQEQETYKYLGLQQNNKLQHKIIKQQLKEKYTARLKAILNSKLNAKNIFKAINT